MKQGDHLQDSSAHISPTLPLTSRRKKHKQMTKWWWLGSEVEHWSESMKLLYTVHGYGMGDHLLAGKPPWFVTSHSGQLSLLPSVGWKMTTGQCGDALRLKNKGKYGKYVIPR